MSSNASICAWECSPVVDLAKTLSKRLLHLVLINRVETQTQAETNGQRQQRIKPAYSPRISAKYFVQIQCHVPTLMPRLAGFRVPPIASSLAAINSCVHGVPRSRTLGETLVAIDGAIEWCNSSIWATDSCEPSLLTADAVA